MSALADRLRARLSASLHARSDMPEETAEATMRALWLTASGRPASAIAAMRWDLPELGVRAASELDALVERRLSGTPLAHLTGRQHFMGLEMLAGPEALVPRRETELLARTAIAVARDRSRENQVLRVIDVCTGSGNLAAAIAWNVPSARVQAADISPDAVVLAARNIKQLGLHARVDCLCGDLLAPFAEPDDVGSVDMITCNPPYISSARVESLQADLGHEPRLAFDGGPFGVRILMRLMQAAPTLLKVDGWLVFEVGVGQGEAMLKRMRLAGGFSLMQSHPDEQGVVRVLSARR